MSASVVTAFPVPVKAQIAAQGVATESGVLTGRVVHVNGSAVAGVRVTATLEADDRSEGIASLALPDAPLRQSSHAVTDSQGAFAFLRLRAGTYRLSVVDPAGAIPLFATVYVDRFEPAYALLRVDAAGTMVLARSTRADEPAPAPRLAPSNTPQNPDDPLAAAPSGETLDTQTERSAAAESSPGDRADTPQENQDHATGAGYEPGAGTDPSAGSFDGLNPRQNGSTLDGLSAEQGFRSGARGGALGGPVSGATYARGTVRSLRVSPGTYSAAIGVPGGAGAAVFGGSSRAGAAGAHGGGLVTVRTSPFDAANPYAVVTHYHDGAISSGVIKPSDRDVQAGAHVGFAPLAGWREAGAWRERVFGFASLEGRVRNAPIESTPAVPGFYALTPMQQALLGTRGVSTAQTTAALDYLDSLSGEIPRSDTRLLSFGRLDVQPGKRDAVAATFAGNHFRSPAGADFDQLADAVVARGRGSVGDSAIDVEAVAVHWAHAFKPKLENVLHLQWVHDLESELPRAPLAGEPAISPGGEAPEVEIAPEGFTYGTAANLDRTAYPDEHRVEAADTLRWIPAFLHGQHVLTLGGGWSRVGDRIDSLQNANGTFLYDSDDLNGRAGGLVDWITDSTFNVHAYPNGGCPSITAAVHDFCFRTYTQSFGEGQQAFTTHEFAGFAEDSFFARPDLRLTIGVRYEYTLLPLPQAPNAGLDASLRAQLIPTALAGVTGAFPEDRNNVGPRVGIAWSPHAGQWATVHAGYGWFYGRLPGTTVRAALADNGLASGIEQVRITPATETVCPQVANQGFGYPCAFAGQPPSAVAQTGTALFFAGRFRLPAIQRATLTVERQLGRRFDLEAGYSGVLATQLPTSVDVNIAPATSTIHFALQGGAHMPGLAVGRAFSVPLYTVRRLAGYGPVTAIASQANATYHAGSLAGHMRAWHGVEARGSVTFSRAIDDNPESGSTPRINGSFDPFAIGYDKGLSDFQAPLRFAGSVVAQAEGKRGPRAMRSALSGWRAAATATASSGAPYSYEVFGGTRLSGGYGSINGSGGATYLPTIGRNTLRLPARAHLDLRLERGATLHAVKLSGFAEAFNLLNHRTLSRVETRAFLPGTAVNGVTPLVFQDAAAIAAEGVTTPPFGTPTSSTGGASRERQIALGIRVQF